MRCAECGDAGTTWASVNLGVFLCVHCADVHRAVGTHISKVKGCSGTYLWGPDEIHQMQELGNAAAEARYKKVEVKPSASKEERMEALKRKYAQDNLTPDATQEQVKLSSLPRPVASAPQDLFSDFEVLGHAQHQSRSSPLTTTSIEAPHRSLTGLTGAVAAAAPPLGTSLLDDLFKDFDAIDAKMEAPAGADLRLLDDLFKSFDDEPCAHESSTVASEEDEECLAEAKFGSPGISYFQLRDGDPLLWANFGDW